MNFDALSSQFSFCIVVTRKFGRSTFERGGGQNFERPNVQRPIFRNFEISNIKMTNVEVFDFSIFEFIVYFYIFKNYPNAEKTYMIIH